MTDSQPDTENQPDTGYQRYADALTQLHAARCAVGESHRGARQRRAARAAELGRLTGGLHEQRDRLTTLATELGAAVTAEQLSPLLDPPPLPWHAGADDARARLAGADAALAEVRRVARLPQLLPQWSSRLARAAVVYLGLTLPNILLVVLLSVAGVRGNTPVLVWFVVIWPLVTAVGGAWLIGRVEAPRLPPTEPLVQLARASTQRRYPWLGVLIAWAGWLLPGWLLDQLAQNVG